VANALVYRLVAGPVASLDSLPSSRPVARDTASTFDLVSTGASRLYIDGALVAENPAGGTESSKSGQITVLRGLRRIRVLYAQDRPGTLGVFMTAPGRARAPLGPRDLRGSIFGWGQTGIDGQ
jgi:hypothetical protein